MKAHLLTSPRNTVWDTTESEISSIFQFTLQAWQADIWVANQESVLREKLEQAIQLNRKKPKACILWTHEPYFSTTTATRLTLYGCPIEVFNVWNGRAIKQNGVFLTQNLKQMPPRPAIRTEWRSSGKKTCCLMTYPQANAKFTQERLIYASKGYELGQLDLYGKGWPEGMSLGNSRDGDWWTTKPEILKRYDNNLSLENCVQPYYVTEKLWDSILNGCLPIYGYNGTIYDDFDRDTFLDVRDFQSPEKLWEKVESMSLKEWNKRFEGCWRGMESLWKVNQANPGRIWEKSILQIQDAIENLT